jgi:hypothetical protein
VVALLLGTAGPAAARQQQRPVAVAVMPSEPADTSFKRAAERLTQALRATAASPFALYDTVLTRKAVMDAGGRQVPQFPTRYTCLSRITASFPGWVQGTVSFVDQPGKEPVVRVSLPVLLSSDSSFTSLARFAWERLLKTERKNIAR